MTFAIRVNDPHFQFKFGDSSSNLWRAIVRKRSSLRTDRQTNRQTGRQTDRQIDIPTVIVLCKFSHACVYGLKPTFCATDATHKATAVKAHGQRDSQTERHGNDNTPLARRPMGKIVCKWHKWWRQMSHSTTFLMSMSLQLLLLLRMIHDEDGVGNDDDDDDDYNDDADKRSVGYKSFHIIAMTSFCIHLKPLLWNYPIVVIVDVERYIM